MTLFRSLFPYLITAAIAMLLLNLNHTIQIGLKHEGIYSGLFLMTCFLASLSLECFVTAKRKIHTQIGLMSIFLYFVHAGFSLPTGLVEIVLTLGYLLLAITGIFGAFLSSALARRLTHVQFRLPPDAILRERDKLGKMAEQSLLDAIAKTNSPLIERLYLTHLGGFFSKQTNLVAHVLGSSPDHLAPFTWIDVASKSGTREERAAIREIHQLAIQKFDLDRQNILQYINKYWCMFHKVVAWSLLVVTITHVSLVLSFVGPMF